MEQLANNASTTLNGAINNSVTSITVTTGSVFPSSGDFRLLIDTELLLCTARSGNTLTVTRGHEGSSADSHVDGSEVLLVLTKGSLEKLLEDLFQFGPYSSRPSTPRTGTIYRASDVDLGWRYNGTQWDLVHPIYVPYANRVDFSSGWTAVNHGSDLTNTNIHGVGNLKIVRNATFNLRGYYRSMPTAPYAVTIAVRDSSFERSVTHCTLGWHNTSDNKLWTIQRVGGGGSTISIDAYNSPSSLNTAQYRTNWEPCGIYYLRLKDNSSNWLYQVSLDGFNFITIFQNTINQFLTPNAMFVGGANNTDLSVADHTIQVLGYWE